MARGISGEGFPTEPLREAFLRSGLSKSELARRLGWTVEKPNTQQVNRYLGLTNSQGLAEGDKPREFIRYEKATEIVEALGIDPVEVGL